MDDFLKRRLRSGFKVPTRSGWHRHHILPNNVRRYPDLRDFLGRLGDLDVWLGDFCTNGMFLPAEESVAHVVRLPLHRGSHRTYNAVVINALDGIRTSALHRGIGWHGQVASVLGLQRRLRVLLQMSALDGDVTLAGRDPFGPIPVAAALDRKTDALFAKAIGGTHRQAEADLQPLTPSAACAAASRAMGTR